MTRTALISILALSAGLAYAGPGHDHKHTDHEHAEQDRGYKTLAELYPDQKKPELWIGSSAPKLQLAHFSRGESITSFEPGRVYVVEMWATWCGPCIAAFPHVADLQKKYADDISVIGVNIWERAEGQERVDMVDEFVAEHTEMKYTVAIEDGTAMADTWMKPAGRNGIPAAFIVDGTGKIAWMGHPMQMDEPLDQIVKGEFDIKSAAAEAWTQQLAMTAFGEMRQAAGTGDADRVLELGNTLAHDAFAEDASGLNAVAWMLLSDENAGKKALELAHKSAKTACEMTEWGEWMILDTYALAAFRHGDRDEAVKWQTKAIELAPDQYKGDLQEQLESFTAEG